MLTSMMRLLKDKTVSSFDNFGFCGAPSPQVTLQTIYEFMLDDLNKAVEDLPVHSESILHPNRALGYGMLARVYLSMGGL